MTQHDSLFFQQAAERASDDSGMAIRCTGVHRYNQTLVAARFNLDNGLTIILMPDARAPVFAYQTWFKVGSKHEHPNRTGLAHLFEHLMFKGTEKHAAGEFDREMEKRGSQTNAATWVDWTFYMQSLAARGDNLPTVVEFESDRMARLIIDEVTFRSELEVVKNERRMSVDDSITGLMAERLMAMAYHKHSYRWPTIGSMAHLEASTLDDLRQFYRTHYAPNNAILVLAGAIEAAPTLALLAKHYGPLQSQAIHALPRETEPEQTEARSLVLHRPIVAAQMLVAFHAPSQRDPDYVVLEMLAEILASGDTARLYRRLVIEDELATDVDASLTPFSEPGLFELQLALRPDASHEAALAALQDELDKIAKTILPREISKACNSLELALLDGMQELDSIAESLGHYETNYGDFALAFRDSSMYRAVTAEQLQRVAARIFSVHNRNVVTALPKGDDDVL